MSPAASSAGLTPASSEGMHLLQCMMAVPQEGMLKCVLQHAILMIPHESESCTYRYAGLVKCKGFKKEGGKVVEVHGEFQPLVAGQKLPKARLRHTAALLHVCLSDMSSC